LPARTSNANVNGGGLLAALPGEITASMMS
jgi:hypothetical protein